VTNIRPGTPASLRGETPSDALQTTLIRCDDRGTWLVALHGEQDFPQAVARGFPHSSLDFEPYREWNARGSFR
jgi:hypothetical protein